MKETIAYAAVLTLLMTWAADAKEPTSVTIRGQELTICPAENLAARGFEVRSIPKEQNAAWTYIEAINAYDTLPDELVGDFENALESGWLGNLDQLSAYLDLPGNKTAINLVKKASKKPQHEMPYFGDASESALGILIPNLSHLRFVSKLVVVQGKRLESNGDYSGAAELYMTAMRMGAQNGRGRTLIENLVGIAIWSLGDDAIAQLALSRPLTSGELSKLSSQYGELADSLPATLSSFKNEQAFNMACIDELCSRPTELLFNLTSFATGMEQGVRVTPVSRDGWDRLEMRIGQLIVPDQAMRQHMAGYYEGMLRLAKRASSATGEPPFDEDQYIVHEIPEWDLLSRMVLPSISRALLIGTRAETNYALNRASLALRLFMLKNHGLAPTSLDDLGDLLPEEDMIDPFSGKPFKYRDTQGGWVLYSVGADGLDDGGRTGERWDKLDIARQFPLPVPSTEEGE